MAKLGRDQHPPHVPTPQIRIPKTYQLKFGPVVMLFDKGIGLMTVFSHPNVNFADQYVS